MLVLGLNAVPSSTSPLSSLLLIPSSIHSGCVDSLLHYSQSQNTAFIFGRQKNWPSKNWNLFSTGNFLNLWTIWAAFLSWGCSDLFIIKIYKRPMLGSCPSFNINIEKCRTFTSNGILPCDCETWIKTDILPCIINNLKVQRNFVKKWTSKTTFFNNQPRRNIN